jgi:hypothetical protein
VWGRAQATTPRRIAHPTSDDGSIAPVTSRRDAPRSERVLWAAAWAGPRIAWRPVERLALGAALDLVIPLARYRFEIDGIGVVHRVGPVGGRIRVGLGVRL